MFKTIRNIIKWWPILKEDQDWDYDFLLQVIRFKLKNMADFFESKDAVTANAAEESKAMRLCVGHLDRLIADDFFDLDYMDEKYGKEWLDLLYDEKIPGLKEDFNKACEEEEQARQNALVQFCQIFKDRVFNWWD